MKRLKKIIASFLFYTFFFLFSQSCENRKEVYSPELPATPILSSQQQWAVIKTNYARLFSSKSEEASVIASLRQGDVISVELIEVGDNEEYWYFTKSDHDQGWLEAGCIDLYDSKNQALLASESFAKR